MAPDPRTRIIAAGFMSFMMRGIFTGWHGFASLPPAEAPGFRARAFVSTWPAAFAPACLPGPAAGKTAFAITRRLDARRG